MATNILYEWAGKSLIVNNDTFFTFYGKDFNPNIPSRPSPRYWDQTMASWETSYDLNWFSVGNEVCCGFFIFWNTDLDNIVYVSWDMDFQKSYNGSTYYSTGWKESKSMYIQPDNSDWAYYYVWVDSDEIWIWETYYRFHVEWSSTDGSTGTINIPFTVSNLSFDDSLHPSWYLWVEWNYLCYTDATEWNRWYKHKINYDSYTWWSGDPWYIRVPENTSWYIYYTDANGRVRRTHFADERYGWSRYWTPWYIYVSNGNYTQWYWYLCFVDGNWELRRMWNWQP